MGRLADKVAIVTGGASGIGFGVASGFAREGARVVVADLSLAKCAEACRAIAEHALPQKLDVRDLSSIDAMVAEVTRIAGGIDILVNCAGVVGVQMIVDLTLKEYDRVMNVNARGLMFTVSAVARQMIKDQRSGAIVNISSLAGRRGAPGSIVYSASKAAVISVTQTAAQELIPHGIRVNAIAPGAVLTPMWDQVRDAYQAELGTDPDVADASLIASTPDGRMATPEDFVGAAIFLASSESEHVIGQTLNIDGGKIMN